MPTNPIYKSIGAIIKARRKKLQIKQEALASTIGISRGSLANVETGRQSILVHQLYTYANALQFAPSDLLPPVPGNNAILNRADLPLPTGLKAQQKQQIARFFMHVDSTQNPKPEVRHAKNRS